ncbi:EAL domain-containing protein [Bacillus pinisoli]|uniref:EAL domain-containing protein n=1 Tax=Bacillus pinisoli TaxID=2901866 RepID=UPI001FF3A8A5|nr:EAL domain-containing protein [Bacillus pinisoli]
MPFKPWESYKTSMNKWGKLALPQKHLRFYPPTFILRDPIVEGVELCFKQGHQAAMIVFNHANLDELLHNHEIQNIKLYNKMVKDLFIKATKDVFPDQLIISMHNHLVNGHAIIVKVEHENCVSEIEKLMNEIMSIVLTQLSQHYREVSFQFESGYIFIERGQTTIKEAILKAYQQANTMAEKKTTSTFNELRFEMNRIIQHKDIRLMAQPIVDVSTNQTTAYEFLTRGPSGTHLENPLQLFAVARQMNLLFDLETIVLERAFEQIQKQKNDELVFINFTPITLANPAFIKVVRRMLIRFRDVNPYRIIFEITERDSIDGYKHFGEHIKALRKMGFQIAVDDTGAGYSSLHTISEVLPDIIKIDRSVIQDIDTNKVKESMLKGLLLIAKETGSIVVAEGIEKEEEASVLSKNNVDLAQGYFYAKPQLLPGMVSSL